MVSMQRARFVQYDQCGWSNAEHARARSRPSFSSASLAEEVYSPNPQRHDAPTRPPCSSPPPLPSYSRASPLRPSRTTWRTTRPRSALLSLRTIDERSSATTSDGSTTTVKSPSRTTWPRATHVRRSGAQRSRRMLTNSARERDPVDAPHPCRPDRQAAHLPRIPGVRIERLIH